MQIDFDQDDTPDCVTTIGDGDDFEPPQPGEVVDIGTCLPIWGYVKNLVQHNERQGRDGSAFLLDICYIENPLLQIDRPLPLWLVDFKK